MAFRLNAKLFSPTEALFDAARATSKGIEAKGTVEVEGVSCTTCRGKRSFVLYIMIVLSPPFYWVSLRHQGDWNSFLTDTLLHRNCDINEEEERRGREGVVGDDESTYETKSGGQRGDR
ncbi:hypothetical protein V1478_016636 [Vespula squamosa]|uniref:Uncharacterized protein n=1 Tax=Vespula squamosa TaxID=30214 RepID=A0ABD2A0C9_VESSQ